MSCSAAAGEQGRGPAARCASVAAAVVAADERTRAVACSGCEGAWGERGVRWAWRVARPAPCRARHTRRATRTRPTHAGRCTLPPAPASLVCTWRLPEPVCNQAASRQPKRVIAGIRCLAGEQRQRALGCKRALTERRHVDAHRVGDRDQHLSGVCGGQL